MCARASVVVVAQVDVHTRVMTILIVSTGFVCFPHDCVCVYVCAYMCCNSVFVFFVFVMCVVYPRVHS